MLIPYALYIWGGAVGVGFLNKEVSVFQYCLNLFFTRITRDPYQKARILSCIARLTEPESPESSLEVL